MKKKNVVIIVIAIILLAAGGTTYAYLAHRDAEAASKVPQYETILPDNSSIDSLGGWKRVSPPESDPVFAYTDTIDDVAISVSQQRLPESFKENVNERTAQLAKAYNANETFEANDMTIYIGTSSRGPQSVIFTKDELLILIKSQKSISNSSWQQYISKLQ